MNGKKAGQYPPFFMLRSNKRIFGGTPTHPIVRIMEK